jgi:hypothetical protein
VDEAWILLPAEGKGWALFVFLARAGGPPSIVRLEAGAKGSAAQWFGIELVRPGDYKTACGKGYFDCEPGEPEVLKLRRPALMFFKYQSAASIFWWDPTTQAFKRTWVSD